MLGCGSLSLQSCTCICVLVLWIHDALQGTPRIEAARYWEHSRSGGIASRSQSALRRRAARFGRKGRKPRRGVGLCVGGEGHFDTATPPVKGPCCDFCKPVRLYFCQRSSGPPSQPTQAHSGGWRDITAVACKIALVTATDMTQRLASASRLTPCGESLKCDGTGPTARAERDINPSYLSTVRVRITRHAGSRSISCIPSDQKVTRWVAQPPGVQYFHTVECRPVVRSRPGGRTAEL